MDQPWVKITNYGVQPTLNLFFVRNSQQSVNNSWIIFEIGPFTQLFRNPIGCGRIPQRRHRHLNPFRNRSQDLRESSLKAGSRAISKCAVLVLGICCVDLQAPWGTQTSPAKLREWPIECDTLPVHTWSCSIVTCFKYRRVNDMFFFIPQTEEFGHLGIVMTSRCEVAIKSIQSDDLNLVFIGIIRKWGFLQSFIQFLDISDDGRKSTSQTHVVVFHHSTWMGHINARAQYESILGIAKTGCGCCMVL